MSEYTRDERRAIKDLWNHPLLVRARADAAAQVESEVRNLQASCSPLSDSSSMEALLRSQGKVNGAARFQEVIDDLITEEQ